MEAKGSSGLALIVHDATETRRKTFAAIESERMQALTLLAASVAHVNRQSAQCSRHPSPVDGPRTQETAPFRSNQLRRRNAGGAGLADPLAESVPTDSVLRLERFLAVAKGEIVRLDYIVRQFLEATSGAPPAEAAPAARNRPLDGGPPCPPLGDRHALGDVEHDEDAVGRDSAGVSMPVASPAAAPSPVDQRVGGAPPVRIRGKPAGGERASVSGGCGRDERGR